MHPGTSHASATAWWKELSILAPGLALLANLPLAVQTHAGRILRSVHDQSGAALP